MEKIVLLYGGKSSEREISIKSSEAIEKALIELNYSVSKLDPSVFTSPSDLIAEIIAIKPLIVFIGLHGGDGEDGNIQTLLAMHNIKFTGTGSLGSKIAMDKYISKLLASDLKIPVPNFIYLSENETLNKDNLKFPLVVKPNNGGSSVGVSIVKDINQLDKAIQEAFKHDTAILIEDYIPGRELTVTVLGEKTYPVVEIKPENGWYDYQNKYTKGNTNYICPAVITDKESELVSEYALKYYKRLNLKAYARIDFRFDGDKFYFLEANTLPGMTSLSLTPMSVKERGISFTELIQKIINYSLRR